MSLVERNDPSGLAVMEYGQDYKSCLRDLRAHDDQLRLVPQPTSTGTAWKVMRYRGGDQPADVVTVWWNEHGDPLPLSSGLVEKVKRLDRTTRNRMEDPDERNQRAQEAVSREEDEHLAEIVSDNAKRMKRSPAFHRGQHLRRHGRLDGP